MEPYDRPTLQRIPGGGGQATGLGCLVWSLTFWLTWVVCGSLLSHSQGWMPVTVAAVSAAAVGTLRSPRAPWLAGLLPLSIGNLLWLTAAYGIGGGLVSPVMIALQLLFAGFLPGLLVVWLITDPSRAGQADG